MIGGLAGAGQGATQRRSQQVIRYPAPVRGMDIRKAIGSEDLQYSIYNYNIAPYEYGLRVRSGYREWEINLDEGEGTGVHTLIPFISSASNSVGNALFAVTNEGIWDVTTEGAAPTKRITFSNTDTAAGYGTYSHYTTDAGTVILYYADSLNGLFRYDAATQVWTQATGINHLDELLINSVVIFKQRIWFTTQNSTTAYYLNAGAITGQATAFYFGSKFKHGGNLRGLFNWSVDGGSGADDQLVAVSGAGDVIVYKGSDPTESDWDLVGTYYIGKIPNTSRFGSEHGGELYLLSAYGLASMNDILKGVDTNVLLSDVDSAGMTVKIGGLIRDAMETAIDISGWAVSPVPSIGGVLITAPIVDSSAPIQYYYNIAADAWGLWRNVPILSFEEFEDKLYIGTPDGRVCRMDVPVDNQKINPIDPLANGDSINFSILTAYSSMGVMGQYKRIKLIRPDFISSLKPEYSSVARYDYDTAEATPFQLGTGTEASAGLWDISRWDSAVWGNENGKAFNSVGGTWGYGRYVAIATTGVSRTDTRLIGWDVMFDVGGTML